MESRKGPLKKTRLQFLAVALAMGAFSQLFGVVTSPNAIADDASAAACMQSYLSQLHRDPSLISQTNSELHRQGLIGDQGSMLCGPTCASYLVQAFRKALKIESIHATPASEIKTLAQAGYFLGENVGQSGMTARALATAIRGNLALHGVQSEASGLTLIAADAGAGIRVTRNIGFTDLAAPPGIPQGTIIAVQFSPDARHYILLTSIDPKAGRIQWIDPMNPSVPRSAKIFPLNNAQGASTLVIELPNGRKFPVTDVVRVRLFEN